MLIFLDESYQDDGNGTLRHAYGGFGIHPREYRNLVAAIHQCKLKYFRHADGLTPEQIREARRTHFITAEPPEDAEIKADKLLTAKQAMHHQEFGDAPGILMAEEILGTLGNLYGTVFGVLSRGFTLAELQRGPILPVHLCRLLERVELWMREQHDDEHVMIVPDTTSVDRSLSKRTADFLYRSKEGQRMRHIVPNPFWVDSQTTAGSQVADIIVHILMNGMMPRGTNKPLDGLWRLLAPLEFRSVDMETRGIRNHRKKQPAGAIRPPTP